MDQRVTPYWFLGKDHAAVGSAGQERPQEAAARPHPGDGAQGRAGAGRAHQRRALARARAAAAACARDRLVIKLIIKKIDKFCLLLVFSLPILSRFDHTGDKS